MANPLLVDTHLHIYRSREWGIRRLANYSIGEYGEKENVTSPASNGSSKEAIQDIADAGSTVRSSPTCSSRTKPGTMPYSTSTPT